MSEYVCWSDDLGFSISNSRTIRAWNAEEAARRFAAFRWGQDDDAAEVYVLTPGAEAAESIMVDR